MTITAQVPRSGPFTGNGSTVAFTYGFLLEADTELVVVVRDTTTNIVTDKILTTDYSVAGVGTVGGGTVTFVTAPTATEEVAFLRAVPMVQDLDLQNRGVVSPELLEAQLDELTRITQDHGEAIARAVLADVFNVVDQDQLILDISALAAIASDIAAVATVIGPVQDIADNLVAVQNAAANALAAEAALDEFTDLYLGAKAADPALDNDGNALQVGAFYFNTVEDEVRFWNGTVFVSSVSSGAANDIFTGDGATVAFVLSTAPAAENNTFAYIDGVYQEKAGYSVSGSTLTFSEAPPLDANIEVITLVTTVLAEVALFEFGVSTATSADGARMQFVETFADLATLLPSQIALNGYVTVTSTGFIYQRVVAGHLDYSGGVGVQLDVQPGFGSYNLLAFGAAGDGVTDDAATIQLAIDAVNEAGGGDLIFPQGNYLIGAFVYLKSSVNLIGVEGAKISRNGAFRISGVQTPSLTTLTAGADLKKGSTVVTLDAASYSSVVVGDYLYVKDRTAANADFVLDFVAASIPVQQDPDQWIYMVQTFKIIALLGSNQVRVNAGAKINFPITGAGDIYKVDTVVEDVSIRGLEFVNNAGLAVAAENAFINTKYVYGLNIENCRFKLGGLSGGVYKEFGATRIVNCDFDAPNYLGIFLRQACPNSLISGNTFRNHHGNDASVFIEAHNYNIRIVGNSFDGARNYELTNAAALLMGIQMDAKVTDTVIDGNTFNGYGVGVRMELGCMMNVLSNNVFSNMDICGIRMVGVSYITINSNKFFDCGLSPTPGTLAATQSAIFMTTVLRCVISDNVMVWSTGSAKQSVVGNSDYTTISRNTITGCNGMVIGGKNNEISHNRIKSAATAQVIMISGATNHYNKIEHNRIEATSVTYGVRIDTGSECNIIRHNEFDWNALYSIGLTATSNAQWIHENYRLSNGNQSTVNICNAQITAPVKTTNAIMPRRFRIYKITTSFGVGPFAQHGDVWWEYLMESAGTNYFRTFTVPSAQIGI
jgi:parallel beta-helix repeat protein